MSLTTGEIKPLQPLDSGVVLIVGAKQSNFDDSIKNHPRVIMWSSQHEHWTGKDIPSNTRAVFFTKWVGHKDFGNILSQARKRNVTVFNSMGTGIIARQVRELLGLTRPMEPFLNPVSEVTLSEFMSVKSPVTTEVNEVKQPKVKQETKMPTPRKEFGKLKALIPFIDFSKTNTDNAHILLKKAAEMGITTTHASLAQSIGKQRQKQGLPLSGAPPQGVDVIVQMLDNMIQELKDMRQFLVETVKENKSLKTRMARFKELVGE